MATTSKKSASKAQTLIQAAKARAVTGPTLPAELRVELIEVLEHNASCSQTERVLKEDIYKLAAVWGVQLSNHSWLKVKAQLEQEMKRGK